jgi:hypothetical protein
MKSRHTRAPTQRRYERNQGLVPNIFATWRKFNLTVLRCPHCQNPVEVADLPSGGEVTCVGCGSSFQLSGILSTSTWNNAGGITSGGFSSAIRVAVL